MADREWVYAHKILKTFFVLKIHMKLAFYYILYKDFKLLVIEGNGLPTSVHEVSAPRVSLDNES